MNTNMSQDSSSSPAHSQQKRHSNRPPPRLAWPAGKVGKRPRRESSSSSTNNNNRGLWIDKFLPTCSSDLCVAPKKVKEIGSWLEEASTRRSCKKLLVLVGSPGIGKSVTVRVLCEEKGYSILYWNEAFVPRTRGVPSGQDFSVEQTSALDSFQEFLQQSAVGLQSLEFIFHAKNNSTSLEGPTNPVILLEELPNLHGPDAECKFRAIISEHLQRTQVPTVLVFSDVSEGKHRPQDLERLIDPQFLYSDATTIMQIHPVTKPKMRKILHQVAQKQGCQVTNTMLEELHLQSGGDLRHAIMNMQLLSAGLKSLPKQLSAQNDRDVKLSTFHALGKLMYAKRTEVNGMSVLAYDPELILERSDLGVGGSLSFLQYHSPDFYSDIIELSDSFAFFSDAAVMLEAVQGRHGASSFHQTCASSIAGRAVAHTNTQPTPNKFRQFSTPAVFDVLRKRAQNQILVDELSRHLASSHLSLPSVVGCTNSFVTDLLPSLRIISPNEVEPVVDNLYSVARANANIVDIKTWYQKDQATLKEQDAILAVDDIEDFESDEECDSKPNSIVQTTTNDDRQKIQKPSAVSNAAQVQREAEVLKHPLGGPEIIIIDD